MRLLLYNICYGLGVGRSKYLPLPGAGYLFAKPDNLKRITSFIKSQDPDIVGLIEVDTGSIRSRRINQASKIAESIGHYSVHQCKYGQSSLNNHLPILRKQGNAFLAAPRIHGERFHYFDTGVSIFSRYAHPSSGHLHISSVSPHIVLRQLRTHLKL